MVKARLLRSSDCKTCATPSKDITDTSGRYQDGQDALIKRFNSVIHGDIEQSDTLDRVFVSMLNTAINYKSKRNIFGDY